MKHLLLSTALVLVALAAPAHARHDCATLRLMPRMQANMKPLPILRLPDGAPKALRDAYTPSANMRTSKNFVVKWGTAGSFTPVQADFLLQSLEKAWIDEVETLKFTPPRGSEAHLFNVYIYRTGVAVPDIGYSTYAGIDPEGYPYVMMPAEAIGPGTAYVDGVMHVTAAHELFHTVQMARGAYNMQTNYEAYWYWEASADWMANRVWPDEPVTDEYTPFYLLAPHVGIESVVFPSGEGETFDPIMLHHYGATLLPRYLSSIAGDQLVVDSWMTATPADNPLHVFDRLLAPHGIDMQRAFADFAARSAVVDVDHAADHLAALAAVRELFPAYDRSIAGTIPSTGTTGLVDAPPTTRPEAWAYNVIHMPAPEPGKLEITIEPDNTGSRGTPAVLRARVVRRTADGFAYDIIPDAGTLAVDITDETDLYVIVAAQPSETVPSETFDYRYEVRYVEDAAGCGCRTSSPAGSLVLALLLLGLVARRKRTLDDGEPAVLRFCDRAARIDGDTGAR